jgi:CO/xanthine dehydrogenase FAD-binding subunit
MRIASIDHLILMKRRAGRAQDLVDIEKLEILRRYVTDAGDLKT